MMKTALNTIQSINRFIPTDVDHVTMQIRPKDGVSLELWSFSPLKPEPAAMPPEIDEITYYVYYSHGRKPEKPWTFSLHFKVYFIVLCTCIVVVLVLDFY